MKSVKNKPPARLLATNVRLISDVVPPRPVLIKISSPILDSCTDLDLAGGAPELAARASRKVR